MTSSGEGESAIARGLRGRSSVALVLLVLLACGVLFEALFLDATLVAVDVRIYPPFAHHASADEPARPMNVSSVDMASWLLPEQLAQLAALREGRLPLWNPNESFGQPLLATLGHVPFYPSALLDLVLPPLSSHAVSMALHLVLLGFGMWTLQRRFGLRAPAAILGSLVAMLCAYVTAHLQSPPFVRTIAWLPWVHLAAVRLVADPRARSTGALALAVGAMLLAGYPQIAMLGLYAVAALSLPAVLRAAGRRKSILLHAFLALTTGGAIGSVQLLPALELLGESWRSGGWSPEVMQAKAMAPQTLVAAVLPQLFWPAVQTVSPVAPALRSVWDFPSYAAWQTLEVQNNFDDNALYVGVVPLVLALAAAGRRGPTRRWFLGWIVVLCLALAVPFVAEAAGLLPGFRSGGPKRVLFLGAYALAWLAAAEVDRILSRGRDYDARPLLLGGLFLVALGLFSLTPFERWLFESSSPADQLWFRETLARDLLVALGGGLALVASAVLVRADRARSAVALLVAVSALELVAFARHVNPPQPLRDLYASTPGIDWLAEHTAADGGRIVNYEAPTLLPGSIAQLYGLRSCNAVSSLLPRRSGELMRAMEASTIQLDNPCFTGPLTRPESLTSPILDMVGARYVVTSVPGHLALEAAGPERCGARLVYASETEWLAIYERASALSPAYLVRELALEPDPAARIARIAAPSFDPSRTAVLEEEPADLPRSGLAPGSASYERLSPERIRIVVVADAPAFLVVSETLLPGWRCTVNGAPTPIQGTNHALMGVALRGNRPFEVVLEYAPASFMLGAVLACAGLLCGILLLLVRGTTLRRPGVSARSAAEGAETLPA